jgi:hypothetical protein
MSHELRRDGEAHMDSTIDKDRDLLIDCFSMTRVDMKIVWRRLCVSLYRATTCVWKLLVVH